MAMRSKAKTFGKARRPVRSRGTGPAKAKDKLAPGPGRGLTISRSLVSEPSVARQISRNPKSFRNLLHEMGQAIAASAHGVSSVIVVNVRPGKPHPEIEIIKSGADDDGASELERALAEARERGRKLAAEILSGDEMLSSDAFADRIGVRRPTIHSKRERHEILGLEGPKRGVQFPAWQLDEHGHLFMAGVLPKLFACLGDEWTVYRFLTQAHPEIGKMRTALEALQRGEIAPVLKAAENIASGAFT